MLVHVPAVLGATQVRDLRALIEAGEWIDGNETSGAQAALAKRNLQLRNDCAARREGAAIVLKALDRNPLFFAAALPHRIVPPLFNRYEASHAFAPHIDNAVRGKPGSVDAIRTDIAATLFLSAPEDYDGGELTIADTYGAHQVKLPAGDLIVYPASSIHHVTAITRGVRFAAFFWAQSLIRSETSRNLIFDLDRAIGVVRANLGDAHGASVSLTACYHNLLRQWAEL
jgi:PKHD-type hydroxylase